MTVSSKIVPFSLKDAPSLIERALPVQRLSVESHKEQEGRQSKTLTPLGSYWKGRKPLVLNKAVVLGCLLPATADLVRDLEVFEKLMGMDDAALATRLGLPDTRALPPTSFRERVARSRRAEQIGDSLFTAIWDEVNAHLGTEARSFTELVEQLGVMRFGRRPIVSDAFSGSGQIPFAAALLGADVVATDLNPVACMLTWGAFNLIGGSVAARTDLAGEQRAAFAAIRGVVDELGAETDGRGWRAKVYLYCVEATCPETGWSVPLLPTRIVSKSANVIVELAPDKKRKRYDLVLRAGVDDETMAAAGARDAGTQYDDSMVHKVGGKVYRTKIATLRGDAQQPGGTCRNQLRAWDVGDVVPRNDDVFRERLYAIQWMREGSKGRGDDAQFRAVTAADLEREQVVIDHVRTHLQAWQRGGLVPDMKIEPGDETDRLLRERGWTHWHHLFNPRQLLIAATINQATAARGKFALTQVLNLNSRLSRYDNSEGGASATKGVFDNQALNTLYNYGTRATAFLEAALTQDYPSFPLPDGPSRTIIARPAAETSGEADLFITDPPYGDAVKYEEILEFFIAWLRKRPPPEFAHWTWDSRRALAVKGEGEGFRRDMVKAYRRMTECMPDNGLQIIMFTHQSGALWADMANIVWASGLQVTAAWYVATETDSALRDGAHVKGTVLLVLRKRLERHRVTRDDLAWELQDEVERQVGELTGLTQAARTRYRDENLFGDADLQMAGYAAALRVLTRYAVIDGRDMTIEAEAPRVKGEQTMVDALIEFAVGVANQALVPRGLPREHWQKLLPAERLYLKLLDAEASGAASLDVTQNFAKAFKVDDVGALLASAKAKDVRLKTAAELGNKQQGGELGGTVVRAALYAVWQMSAGKEDLIVAHFEDNGVNLFDAEVRARLLAVIDYLADRDARIKSRNAEASDARALAELLRNQKL